MFEEICRTSGFNPSVCNAQFIPKRQHNQREHRQVSWFNMRQQAPEVHQQLLAKAREYGFDEDCTGDIDIMDARSTENGTHLEDTAVV
jgi:hypothetical protein